jgi:hypothetical protein
VLLMRRNYTPMASGGEFHPGTVVSIIRGQMLSPGGLPAIQAALQHIVQGKVYQHQIGRVLEEAAPWVARQHPALAAFVFRGDAASDPAALFAALERQFGPSVPVQPIPQEVHERLDPVTELEAAIGPDRVIRLDVGAGECPLDRKASLDVCDCEFTHDPDEPEEESVDYLRECLRCSSRWYSLHCPHDGHQDACPRCGVVPDARSDAGGAA